MRALLAVFLMVSLALAGCSEKKEDGSPVTSAECLEQGLILGTDPDGDPVCIEPPFVIESFEDPAHHCVVNEQRDRVHAPDLVGNPWQIGQWWDFRLEVDGVDHGVTRMIYYADEDVGADLPLHYMVGTPTREEALLQAIESINPMIGRVHSVLYSPHESGDHADMFHFPLCDGSSWQTTFYAETFTLTARTGTFTAAGEELNGFLIEGTSASGSTLALTYSTETQWFTRIDLDRADGRTVTMELEARGAGQTGEAFFLRGQQDAVVEVLAEAAGPLTAAPFAQGVFVRGDGGSGPYDTVGISARLDVQGTGQFNVILEAPDGTQTEVFAHPLDAPAAPMSSLFEVPYQAGEWTFHLYGLGVEPGTAQVVFAADVVSIYDQSCTIGGDCLS